MTATRDSVGRPADPPGGTAARRVSAAGRAGRAGPGRAMAAVKEAARPVVRHRHVRVLRRTLDRAWDDRVLGLSAEAAFWQLLSLPPLFLALLGSLGYLSGLLGPDTVDQIERQLLSAFSRAFAPNVVDGVIAPTVNEVLRQGRAGVVSVGFVIALWAGSSATSTFVNTVTIAYGMRDLRGAVRSRLLALFLYLLSVVIGVVLLPVMVLGPERLVRLFPQSVRGDVGTVVNAVYWPGVGLLLLLGLVTFYHLAPPRRLPWLRGFPGALLAGIVFLGGSIGLRLYIGFVLRQGVTYGTLAAPIGALLFFYLLALAVLLGAELNATIEQTWPSRPERADPVADPPSAADPLSPAAHPDGVHPAGAHPAGTDPDGTDPDGTDPDGTDPDGTDPDGTDPDGTDPDGTGPDGP